NGKPPDSLDHFNNTARNPNAASPASATSNSQQSHLLNQSSRTIPFRPQQKFQQPPSNQAYHSPQQVRYINPVQRMPSNWHSTPATPVNSNNTSNQSNNKYLSANPRSVRPSTPVQRPATASLSTTPLSRAVTPAKPTPILNHIKSEDDFISKAASIELEDLRKELSELMAVEKQDAQEKFLSILETDEDFIPQTVLLPPDILVEKIAEENQQTIAECNREHYEFEKKHNIFEHENIFIFPGTDECVDENRPLLYEPDDLDEFEHSREAYRPVIKSLSELMAEHREYLIELRESRIQKYGALSKEWILKQEKNGRNTKKIHKDNKNREVYEKSFPDMRRAREEKERTARSEKRPNAKQEAAAAQAEIDERKKVFGSAIIPPMNRTLHMADQPQGKIISNPIEKANENLTRFLQSWSTFERQTFQRKFLLYGKNFPALSACIGTKSMEECIRYFYLTKQHVKYKQLQKKPKRKKAGKQYKPTMIPTQGEVMIERIRSFPFMRSNKYVECLICEKKMDVFMIPKLHNGKRVTGEYIESIDDTLPICDGCNTHIRKAKAANFSKCPLKSCALGGRKKAKPSRTIPDTANTLEIERRRFIIHHRKLHPEAVKCCGSCIRKIQNDFSDLAAGKLNEQIAQFTKDRQLKKEQKEREGIPSWNHQEIVKLNECIKSFGIGNWYEVACRLNIKDKTPFYCYTKHKQMVDSGEWDEYFAEPDPDPYEEEVIDEESAANYINDLVISNKPKIEHNNYGIRVKEEAVTPPPEIAKAKPFILEDIPFESTSHLDRRERELMRHFYLETIADMEEKYLNELLEKQYESDESEIPEDPAMEPQIIQQPPSSIKTPKEEEEEDGSDIQVIHVVPPKKRQTFGGSLTQGTPRPNTTETLVPLPQPPTLGFAGLNINLQPSSDLKDDIQRFNSNQLKDLLVPKTTSQPLLFDNDFKSLFPTATRNEGVSSSSSSITPIDQTATTTAPSILNFFNTDIARMRESPPSPNFPELIAPKNPLGTLLSPMLAPPTRPPPFNWLTEHVPANGLASLPFTSVITQQQPIGLGFHKAEPIIVTSKVDPVVPPPPTLTSPASFFSPGARKQHIPTEVAQEYPRKTATPDLKRKSGVETVCLPHASSTHKSMHIKPHPPPQPHTPVIVVPVTVPTPENLTQMIIPISKAITPPRSPSPISAPVVAVAETPSSSVPSTSASTSTSTTTSTSSASGLIPASLSLPMVSEPIALNVLLPRLHERFLNEKSATILAQERHLQEMREQDRKRDEMKEEERKREEAKEEAKRKEEQRKAEMLPPPASPEPEPLQGLHIEVEPEPAQQYLGQFPLYPYEPLVTTVNHLPAETLKDIFKRISTYPDPHGVEKDGPFAIRKYHNLTSAVSDSHLCKPKKKVKRPLSAGIDPKLIIDPENPPMDVITNCHVDDPVRIGESAMTPHMEDELALLGAPTICGENRGSLLAPFDGIAPSSVKRHGYHLYDSHIHGQPPEKKFRPDVYFSDDEGPRSPDDIGDNNVTWMGDPLPPPPETRDIVEIDPFEKFKFSKRKNGKISDGSSTNFDADSTSYTEDTRKNLKLERVFIDWNKAARGMSPKFMSALMNSKLNCQGLNLKIPPRPIKKQKKVKTKKLKKKRKKEKKDETITEDQLLLKKVKIEPEES
uniref:SANT domain-containing protein n=1 Tax=Panagrolaimus sp. ES5 TaxID=591445 RepID=A0AC34GUZ1_9BILA